MRATASYELVSGMLREYGEMTRSQLDRYLPSGEPRRYLYDLVADYPRRGGRMLRSSLCLATARAFGAPPELALRSAISIELAHDAFLVHQDVADGTGWRRGRPTLHVLYGEPLAINAGVTTILASLRPLMENEKLLGPILALRILEEFNHMTQESAEGQALELGWRHEGILQVGEAEYLEMLLKRNSWPDIVCPCRVGALIAGRGGADLDRLTRFGFCLGVALTVWEELQELLGEEAGTSLHLGRRTLPLIHLSRRAGAEDLARLYAVYHRRVEERTGEEVGWVRERLEAYGSLRHARQVATEFAEAALREHERTFGRLAESRDRLFLAALARSLLEDLRAPSRSASYVRGKDHEPGTLQQCT